MTLLNKKSRQEGQVVITLVVLFLFISLGVVSSSSYFVSKEAGVARDNLTSKKSYFLAESGLEDAVYRLKNSKSISPEEVLVLDGNTATTTITDSVSGKDISVVADVLNRFRKTTISLSSAPGFDFFYGAHVGAGGLEMYGNSIVNGNVFSNGDVVGFSNSEITGDVSAVGVVSSPDPTVGGTITTGVDPVPIPPFDSDFWKNAANINNDPYIGHYIINDTSSMLGPRKIEGNLIVNSNSDFTMTGPIHVTGNFEMYSNTDLYLDESFGSNNTVLIVDGRIILDGNVVVHKTSADPAGYVFLASLATGSAIELNSNADAGAIYAGNGRVDINANSQIVSITAYKVRLNSNAELNYDLGLQSSGFSSGPGGSWVLGNWREVE